MKRFLIVISIFLFASVLLAEMPNCCVEWDKDCCEDLIAKDKAYKEARNKAKESKDVDLYIEAAKLALEYGNNYGAAWQYNNAGYQIILEDNNEGNNVLMERALKLFKLAKEYDEGKVPGFTAILDKNIKYCELRL